MSAEFATKLQSRYLNNGTSPTPNQIQNHLDKMRTYKAVVGEIDIEVPPLVIQMFLTKRGVIDQEKLEKFKLSAEERT